MRRIKYLLVGSTKIALVLVIAGMAFLAFKNYQILKRVYSYEEALAAAVEKYQIPQYKQLAMGIMMTESKGKGTDPMQSSESAFGQPNQFDDPKDSIEQGVAYLAEMLQIAKENNCDIWTAVQAYNFGVDYIYYVAENGQKNSLQLADTYSREVLSPLLGNDTQQTYRYWGIRSIVYNGGYLYHNGGNLFYADLVKYNEVKIKIGQYFF